MTERLVVLTKSGNADEGKEPWFKADAGSDEGVEIGATLQNSVIFQELRNAYQVEAKGELELVSRNPASQRRSAWVVAASVMNNGARCALGCLTIVIGTRDFLWAKA